LGAAAGGDEAAPHPPRAEHGDGDVAAGGNASLFAEGNDSADVDEVSGNNYDDVHNLTGRQIDAKVGVVLGIAAVVRARR
jgi:hypothetical protein